MEGSFITDIIYFERIPSEFKKEKFWDFDPQFVFCRELYSAKQLLIYPLGKIHMDESKTEESHSSYWLHINLLWFFSKIARLLLTTLN